jgi:nitroimidazol reductase NimA-like FMN-containing flavoprotein (pyridoxamine 5'-phosphate oxidase superfamily)
VPECQGIDVLDELDEATCLELLDASEIGRVVVSVGSLPAAFPVNIALHRKCLLFWTGQGTKLAAAVAGTVVAIEVDDVDTVSRSGWSVLAVGQSYVVSDPDVIAWAHERGLASWADGEPCDLHLVAVPLTMVSGRRVGVARLASHCG